METQESLFEKERMVDWFSLSLFFGFCSGTIVPFNARVTGDEEKGADVSVF